MLSRRNLLKMVPNLSLGGMLTGGISKTLNEKTKLVGSIPNISNIYSSIGVRPLINARGTVTIVGASRILPEVKDAMDAATRHYVQLDELMERVGYRLAELTGAQYGCVTSGASAAITVATLGCITRGDPDKLWQIPDLQNLKDEVIIPAYSRTAYECAAKAVGVKMIEVSNQEELKAALGPRTAMILVLTGSQSENGPLAIKEIANLAKPLGVPILADAAAEELVVPNPHLSQGADLVVYSGGKCLRGPQCAGLLIGRKDLVEASWISGAPHHGFARGQKVGREEIMGMLTAVEMWFKRNHQEERRIWNQWLKQIAGHIRQIKGVRCDINQPGDRLSNRFPSLQISWDPELIPLTGYDVENLLWEANPRIAVSGAGSYLPFPPNMQPYITINPSQLESEEVEIIAKQIFSVMTKPPHPSKPGDDPLTDISGQWDLEINFTASLVSQTFVFEQKGNELMGTHNGSFASRELTGTIRGKDLLIRSSYVQDGVRLNFEFAGTVKEDTMEGQVSLGEYGKASWKAKRHSYKLRGNE